MKNIEHSNKTISRISLLLFTILISLAVYFPAIQADFVLDDYAVIVQNPLIKQPALYPQIFTTNFFNPDRTSVKFKLSYYRPVTLLSFLADYRIWHLNPWGYRLINILIHSLNCFLIYRLVMLLFKEEKLAIFSSLFFCILPIHEWVINNVVGRSDLLQALFLLASLYQLLLYLQENNTWRFYISIGLFILAILSREVALFFPLFVVLVCTYQIKNKKDIFLTSLPFFIIAIFYFIIRLYTLPIVDESIWSYFSLQHLAQWFNIFFEYATRFVFPWSLQSIGVPMAIGHIAIWFVWLFYILICIVPWAYLRFKKEVMFGFLWVFLTMLPLFIMEKLVLRLGPYLSECFLYFSSVGFVIIFSSLLLNLNRFFERAVFIAFFVFYITLNIYNNSFWSNEEKTLKKALLTEGSYSYMAGMQILMKYEDNITRIKYLIDHLDNLSSKSIWVKRLGNIYRKQGDYAKAVEYFKKAIVLNTENTEAYNELAVTYFAMNHFDIGLFWLEESLMIDPESPETYRLLGIAAYRMNNYPLAIKYLEKFSYLDPDQIGPMYYLSMAYFFNAQEEKYLKIVDLINQKSNQAASLLEFAAQELFAHRYFRNTVHLIEGGGDSLVQDKEMLTLLAQSYLLLGEIEKSNIISQKIFSLNQENK